MAVGFFAQFLGMDRWLWLHGAPAPVAKMAVSASLSGSDVFDCWQFSFFFAMEEISIQSEPFRLICANSLQCHAAF